MLAGWAGEPKGHRPDESVLQACGQLRLTAAQKYDLRTYGWLTDGLAKTQIKTLPKTPLTAEQVAAIDNALKLTPHFSSAPSAVTPLAPTPCAIAL